MPQTDYITPEAHTAFLTKKIYDDARLECLVALIGPGGRRLADHAHPHDHVIYVTEGSVTVSLNGDDVTLHQDQTLLIPAGTRHSIRNPSPAHSAKLLRMALL
ncbi:cupin domain-containing protein [Opitutaceae bacterium TAV4]|uniref:cupin domain-containing protein n=1 Tax=Geminisphaera colitermitum TaxID=1148786 RepID=UPI000158CA9F|nr:cupin domain-containing protein [Geminisphaera colitermitum]RRJ95465.1 cupin domain-containing protein [Opitutaceae bacterium TAV4]RRJ99643.1 cupin domain-containing protein [Opitutaceae bacterium TAV3]